MFQLPTWAETVFTACTEAGAAVGAFLFLRSGTRKAIEDATARAIAKQGEAEKAAGDAQRLELESLRAQTTELRAEVQLLRQQLTAQTNLISNYAAALGEKELQISTLQRQLRDRDAMISSLEARCRLAENRT